MSPGKAGTLLPELADCCALRTEPSARRSSGTHRKFRFREFMPSSDSAYALAFRSAHRAFIIADNFFRIAALIGLRPVVFFETGVPFWRPGLPFCFAHQGFFAAPILARAAGLIRRRFLTLAGLAWLFLGGRPRRAGWEPSSVRAAMTCSIRPASCLSSATMLRMSMFILS